MPNIKIFAAAELGDDAITQIREVLPRLRSEICRELAVDLSLAQIAVVTVWGLPDQASIAVELVIMPDPDRTHDRIVSVAGTIRSILRAAVDTANVVRVTTVDPANYLVVR